MHFVSQIVASTVFALGLCVVGGCDDDSSEQSGSVEPRYQVKNAPVLNGANLNGFTLNGFTLNGFTLNGFTLNGFTLNGFTLNGFTLNGTLFNGTRWVDGVPMPIGGLELIGSRLVLLHEDDIYVLIFDDIHLDANNPAGDVYLYDISVYDVNNDITSPLCTLNGQPAPAIPLSNHWDMATGDRIDDPSAVTFACAGGALAKCVNWGYRPWATVESCDPEFGTCTQLSLADHHQSCTRMVRADYCGDGVPHTVDGTLIDAFDHLSPAIQAQTSKNNPMWGVEAEWGPDGARCVGTSLRLQHLTELGVPFAMPECLAELDAPDCGEFAPSRGALVGNSYCGAFGKNPKSCN
jgi:hypothetical protein